MKKLYMIALLLGGCSTWSGDFDCDVGKGMKCASLSKVNKAMDRGEIDLDEDDDTESIKNSKAGNNRSTRPVYIWLAPQKVDLSGYMPLNVED